MKGTPGWEVPECGCEGAGRGNEVGKEGGRSGGGQVPAGPGRILALTG